MKAWLASLDARERGIVVGGAIVLTLLLVYFLGWTPLANKVERLEQSIVEQRADAQWMKSAAAEVARLRTAAAMPGAGRGGQSLLAVVDRTAKQGQLGNAIKRIEPDGQNAVRVWFEDAPFDDVVRWLGGLQQQGVQVTQLTLDRPGTPGRINARLVLEGSA